MVRRLDSATQTIYAELLERSIYLEASDVLGAAASGSVVSKQIKGRKYWYLQKNVGSRKRQFYLGPDSRALRDWIDRVKDERGRYRAQRDELRRLGAMVVSGGIPKETPDIVRVVEFLAEAGVFRRGGVLIGTVAFRVLGTVLGVVFEGTALRTQDIDIAQAPELAVGLTDTIAGDTIGDRLLGSELGIQPIPSLDRRSPSISFVIRSRQLRIDFLVPARGAQKAKTVFLPAFGLSATPLRFLEYLIESPIRAVVTGNRPVLVNVPDPARFALHKIYSAITRSPAFHVKSAKDLRQASVLIEVLAEDRPEDLAAAWRALEVYPRVVRKVRGAVNRLGEEALAGFTRVVS